MLREAGIDCISISLNATSAEQRQEIMGLKDWDKVLDNVQYALKNKGDMDIFIKSVVNGDQFKEEHAKLLDKFWGNVLLNGGSHQPVTEGNWAGENRTIRDFDPKEACYRALEQIYITVDGRVTTCCFDPDGKQVFGNVREQTLRDIYASDEYVAFRKAHSENRADQYDICAKCSRI
jgi:radical SAM protein with 4Fe4S-binding SPASM domain